MLSDVREKARARRGGDQAGTIVESKIGPPIISRMIVNLAYLRSLDRWCRARRHGPVATQRRSTSTEQLFCANGVASTSKRRERSPRASRHPRLTPNRVETRHAAPPSHHPPRYTTDATLQSTLTRISPGGRPSSACTANCIPLAPLSKILGLSRSHRLSPALLPSSRLPPLWHMRESPLSNKTLLVELPELGKTGRGKRRKRPPEGNGHDVFSRKRMLPHSTTTPFRPIYPTYLRGLSLFLSQFPSFLLFLTLAYFVPFVRIYCLAVTAIV